MNELFQRYKQIKDIQRGMNRLLRKRKISARCKIELLDDLDMDPKTVSSINVLNELKNEELPSVKNHESNEQSKEEKEKMNKLVHQCKQIKRVQTDINTLLERIGSSVRCRITLVDEPDIDCKVEGLIIVLSDKLEEKHNNTKEKEDDKREREEER